MGEMRAGEGRGFIDELCRTVRSACALMIRFDFAMIECCYRDDHERCFPGDGEEPDRSFVLHGYLPRDVNGSGETRICIPLPLTLTKILLKTFVTPSGIGDSECPQDPNCIGRRFYRLTDAGERVGETTIAGMVRGSMMIDLGNVDN